MRIKSTMVVIKFAFDTSRNDSYYDPKKAVELIIKIKKGHKTILNLYLISKGVHRDNDEKQRVVHIPVVANKYEKKRIEKNSSPPLKIHTLNFFPSSLIKNVLRTTFKPPHQRIPNKVDKIFYFFGKNFALGQ